MKKGLGKILGEVLGEAEGDSWKNRTEHFFRVNNVDPKTGYALSRDIAVQSKDTPRGVAREDAVRMKGRDKRSSVYEVTVTMRRIA